MQLRRPDREPRRDATAQGTLAVDGLALSLRMKHKSRDSSTRKATTSSNSRSSRQATSTAVDRTVPTRNVVLDSN